MSHIPMAMPADSAGGLDELLNLVRRQMLPRSTFAVRDAPGWRNFSVFGCRPHISNIRIRRRLR